MRRYEHDKGLEAERAERRARVQAEALGARWTARQAADRAAHRAAAAQEAARRRAEAREDTIRPGALARFHRQFDAAMRDAAGDGFDLDAVAHDLFHAVLDGSDLTRAERREAARGFGCDRGDR